MFSLHFQASASLPPAPHPKPLSSLAAPACPPDRVDQVHGWASLIQPTSPFPVDSTPPSAFLYSDTH